MEVASTLLEWPKRRPFDPLTLRPGQAYPSPARASTQVLHDSKPQTLEPLTIALQLLQLAHSG